MGRKPATTILPSFSATEPVTGVNSIIPNTAAFSIYAGKGNNHGPILYQRIDNGIVYLCRPYFGNFPCFHMDDRIVRNFHNLGVTAGSNNFLPCLFGSCPGPFANDIAVRPKQRFEFAHRLVLDALALLSDLL